jgi:hypothetical protein
MAAEGTDRSRSSPSTLARRANGSGLPPRSLSLVAIKDLIAILYSRGNDGEVDTHAPVSVARAPRDEVEQLVLSGARHGPGDARLGSVDFSKTISLDERDPFFSSDDPRRRSLGEGRMLHQLSEIRLRYSFLARSRPSAHGHQLVPVPRSEPHPRAAGPQFAPNCNLSSRRRICFKVHLSSAHTTAASEGGISPRTVRSDCKVDGIRLCSLSLVELLFEPGGSRGGGGDSRGPRKVQIAIRRLPSGPHDPGPRCPRPSG